MSEYYEQDNMHYKAVALLNCSLLYTNLIANKYSSNFDGKKFYNIKRIPNKNIFDVIKWRLNSTAVEWPKSIEDPTSLYQKIKTYPKTTWPIL